MQLVWNRCEGDKWCPFLTVNLAHPYLRGFEGIYVIWHGGQQPATVYVGQGNIADRLSEHRNNPQIRQFAPLGLFVTWSRVDKTSRDGVERFLADNLSPKVGSHHPAVPLIQVNFPW